jgi:hypothetical protein
MEQYKQQLLDEADKVYHAVDAVLNALQPQVTSVILALSSILGESHAQISDSLTEEDFNEMVKWFATMARENIIPDEEETAEWLKDAH